jgi:hypothetical protein
MKKTSKIRLHKSHTLFLITFIIAIFTIVSIADIHYSYASSTHKTIEPLMFLQIKAPSFSFLPLNKNPFLPSPTPPVKSSTVSEIKPPTSPQINLLNNVVNIQPAITTENIVNILCTQRSGNLRKTVTGTGILIHSDGTVLTNAHIAQYPLVSEKNQSVSCIARSGASSEKIHPIKTVFVSPKWSQINAPFINTGGTTQTGVYDYAFLKITDRNLSSFGLKPVEITYETQPIGSTMLIKSYPGNILAVNPDARLSIKTDRVSLTKRQRFSSYIGETENQFDILETSPSVLGQKGSSGGLIMSLGGYMQAMITITLESNNNAKPIRGITPYHINQDLSEYALGGLETITRSGSQVLETKFAQQDKDRLINLFNQYLKNI